MKIALTTDSFVEGQGGVSTAVATLARNLRQRGHEVVVYTAADPSHKHSDLDIVGLRALRYERFPGGRAPMAPISLVQELADFHPDVIHNHSMGSMGLQSLAAARLLGIPILGTCHVFLAGFLKYAPISLDGVPLTEDLAWRYTTTFFNRFAQVTTPSQAMRRELIAHGLRAPVAAISNGVDTDLFCPASKIEENISLPPILLHIGRLGYEKRVDLVIHAFSHLVKDIPEARLVIVGDGPEKANLQALADELNLFGRVDFIGAIPHAQLPAFYQQADCFVTASTVETQGLVVLEAMASGLPIVGVDALALPELIHPEVNGLLVPPEEEIAFSQATASLLSSADLRWEMGRASRRLALEHSLPVAAQAYEDLYEQAMLQAQPPLLSRVPRELDPAVAWSSFLAEGQAIKEAGVERFWEVSKALQYWAEKAFAPVVEQVRNGLPKRRNQTLRDESPSSQPKE